ncbi:hypothetical protein, partial [Helicobacter rodentium]|uniref:hypothetical protein n=1 Tax=Helicobacter rodentium TaxID=59617 RepID=UPI0025A5EC75
VGDSIVKSKVDKIMDCHEAKASCNDERGVRHDSLQNFTIQQTISKGGLKQTSNGKNFVY